MADNTPRSREEALLQNILGAENELGVPKSRIEKIWQYALGATVELEPAKSRIEELAILVAEEVRNGGGIQPTGTISITDNGTYDVTEYAEASVNVPSSADYSKEDGLIARSLSGAYENPRVTSIGIYGFYSCNQLTSVSLPAVTTIANYAFNMCSNLADVNMPAATDIGGYAFSSTALASAYFPAATKIGGYAFQVCFSLTSANFPVATIVSNQAFNACSNLASVNIPKAQNVGGNAFNGCSKLGSLSLPEVTSIAAQAFISCSILETLNLYSPNRAAIPTLANKNALQSTPIASGTGHIIINDELVDTLKAATNWSNYANVIIGHSDAVSQGIISA